jgi:hypothetical protein
MPHDKATQRSLGLFHGLPPWWKKLQADQQRQQQRDSGETTGTTDPAQGGSQRRGSGLLGSKTGLSGSVPDTSVHQQDWRKGEYAGFCLAAGGLRDH